MGILTLTTDFSTSDYYVAALRGVVLERAPGTTLVDIVHEVPPGDIATAAFLLAAAVPTFPTHAVHLVVVDPGVGTDRRILAVEAASGARFVAPDNGVLDAFFDDARRIVAVDRPDLYRDAPGSTFHGRDRFAPVAAALVAESGPFESLEVERLGVEIDDPIHLDFPRPSRDDSAIDGRIRHVDHFGNLVTDIPADWVSPPSETSRLEIRVGEHRTLHFVDTYANIPEGEPATLVGSLGTLELSLRGDDLARTWGVARGAPVTIRLESIEPREG